MADVETVDQEFFRVELHPDGVMWLHRRPTPYPDHEAVNRGYRQFLMLADDWQASRTGPEGLRAPLGFLYDVRNAPPASNDPAFEQLHHDWRPRLFLRTPALVVLVRTATGHMQMTRLGRHDGSQFYATMDEKAGLAKLREMMSL
ncbi:MAG: hypothetical protein AAF447_27450 [Myxococcota bacterium]